MTHWPAAARLGALALCVPALVGCGSASATADRSNAQQLDSCAALTVADASVAYGSSLQVGRDSGAGEGCVFRAPAGGYLSVYLSAGDSVRRFADTRDLLGRQSSQVVDLEVPGSDGEAIGYRSNDRRVSGAEARVGDVRVRIVATGADVPDLRLRNVAATVVRFVDSHR